MNKPLTLTLVFCLGLSACGPRESGYAPGENALTVAPYKVIDLQKEEYELPEASVAPTLSATYATGDSSGGRIYRIPGLSPELEEVAEGTTEAVAEAVVENAVDPGLSTTVNDENFEAEGDSEGGPDPFTNVDGDDDSIMGDDIAGEDTFSETDITEEEDGATDEAVEADSPAMSDEAASDDSDSSEVSTEEADSEADTEILAQAGDFDWQALGESTYGASCVSCHQANGQGIPGAFPPLAAHMPTLYNVEGGREYIINVVLYGLQGEIEVDGSVYNGVMTPWAQLSDEEIAATLNHELTSWDNEALLEDFSPLTPDEVAALRDQGLSSSDVLELRPELP